MPRTANQRLVDALVRHQVFLTGYSKSLSDKIGQTLSETTPEMRRHLLDVFASNDTDFQSLRRLKIAESRLIGLRSTGWSVAQEQFIDSLAELLQYEPDFLAATVSRLSSDVHVLLQRPELEQLRSLISKASVIAGRTFKEVWRSLVSSDLARIIGATRIGYFAREAGSKIAARVVGTAKAASPIVTAALGAVETVVSTAVTALAGAARSLTVESNDGTVFSGWELWVSVLDTRTTQGCIDLDGKIFEHGVGIQHGYHYGCRSERVPLMEDQQPQQPVEQFADWVEVQGSKFKKFLGKVKGKFSKLGIKPLNLSEVQRLDEETLNETE